MLGILDGIAIVQTCKFAPEQYDVFADKKRIGYIRLRGGWFSVAISAEDDEGILDIQLEDSLPCFKNQKQREEYVDKAVEALCNYHKIPIPKISYLYLP